MSGYFASIARTLAAPTGLRPALPPRFASEAGIVEVEVPHDASRAATPAAARRAADAAVSAGADPSPRSGPPNPPAPLVRGALPAVSRPAARALLAPDLVVRDEPAHALPVPPSHPEAPRPLVPVSMQPRTAEARGARPLEQAPERRVATGTPPVIEVHIGRVEVRAAPAAPRRAPGPATRTAEPLDRYLAERSRR